MERRRQGVKRMSWAMAREVVGIILAVVEGKLGGEGLLFCVSCRVRITQCGSRNSIRLLAGKQQQQQKEKSEDSKKIKRRMKYKEKGV